MALFFLPCRACYRASTAVLRIEVPQAQHSTAQHSAIRPHKAATQALAHQSAKTQQQASQCRRAFIQHADFSKRTKRTKESTSAGPTKN